MRLLLGLIAAIILLAATGCVMGGGHRSERIQDAPAAGVDHGEHPGDLDHGDTQQR